VNKTNPYCKSYILNSFSYIIYCYYSLLLWYVGKEFKTYRSFVANIFGLENPKRPRQSKKKKDDDDDDDDDDADRVRKKGRGSTPPNSPAPRTSPSSSPRTSASSSPRTSSPSSSSGTHPGTSPRASPGTHPGSHPGTFPATFPPPENTTLPSSDDNEALIEELKEVRQLLELERKKTDSLQKQLQLQKVSELIYNSYQTWPTTYKHLNPSRLLNQITPMSHRDILNTMIQVIPMCNQDILVNTS